MTDHTNDDQSTEFHETDDAIKTVKISTLEDEPFTESISATPEHAEELTDGTTDEPEAVAAAATEAVPKSSNRRWDSYFFLMLLVVTAFRLGYLYVVPLDLGPDESYYWDWSRRLDLGYFSKPPMIAWVNALSTKLLGISTEAVRMPAVVFGTLGLLGMYLCGRRLFSAEVGFWAVAAWLATPGTAALGMLMTTDVLLVCCWCLALYTLWRTLESQQSKAFWALLTMLLIGLGSLGKQMMMVFPVLMILYLLLGGEDRGQLKQRWPWLVWIGSLLFLLPPLYWNFKNDWITFKHTAHHVELSDSDWLDHLKTFGEFAGGQMGLLSPVTWVLLFLLVLVLLPIIFKQTRQVRFLLIFGGIGLLAFTGFSFKQSINPNWPATFYPAGLLLLAAWGRGQVGAGFLDRWRSWFLKGLKFGVLLVLLAYVLPFVMQVSFFPLGKKDVTGRIKGWKELAQQVDVTRREQPRPDETFFLSPLRKYPAAIAFYAPGNPRTYKWPGNPPKVSSQYELWPGPVDKLGWDALIVHNAGNSLPEGLAAAFENVVLLGEKSIPIGAAGERKYSIWRGENLLSWPE